MPSFVEPIPNPMRNHADIREAFAQARRDTKARHRDIAQSLAITEGELVAAHVGVHVTTSPLQATRLRTPWPALIEAMEPLGEVMALTRNDSCVHEKTGVYRDASHSGPMGLVLGGAIDLRVFYSRWAHGFAVDETTASGMQRSLQFFDAAGVAVHKVFQREATDAAAWDALVARFTAEDQHAGIVVVMPPAADPERPDARVDAGVDAGVDVDAFRIDWAAMTDTHEFFGLLRRHGVSRTQALRLADPQFAQPAPHALAERVLHGAARDGVPIMVFVGNPGIIQIHSGPVQRVAVMGAWLNVLDPGFNLHLRADHIASAWVVKKPTSDGLVTSLELFDANGETIAMFFGERKPGRPELAAWRQLVADASSALAGERTSCPA